MSKQRLVIVDGIRTPFARMGSDLAGLGADELGRIAVNALLAKTAIDPEIVDEVIFGCVGQPVDAMNVARVIALRAGLPERVPALTVHRNCASGAEALTQAYERMCAGRGDVFVVGGAESMSQYPLLYSRRAVKKFGRLAKSKTFGQRAAAMAAFRPSDFSPLIGLKLGLSDPVSGLNMGQTAELIAREAGITREMQDAFAADSHRKALAAHERRAEEVCPAWIAPDFKKVMTADNGPREDSVPEKLATLKPVFERKTGTVTAGNASQVTDGAVALLVMREARAEKMGLEPLGVLGEYSYVGLDPARMGLGPAYAMADLVARSGIEIDGADLFEINEAFAAQVLAVLERCERADFAKQHLGRDKALGEIPGEKLNVNGGSIALGHPVGASGARLVLTALKELHRRKAKRALITMCVGGGQGGALWVERM